MTHLLWVFLCLVSRRPLRNITEPPIVAMVNAARDKSAMKKETGLSVSILKSSPVRKFYLIKTYWGVFGGKAMVTVIAEATIPRIDQRLSKAYHFR